MDPHGPVTHAGRWRMTTVDGQVFDERTCLWPDLPTGISVAEFYCLGHSFTGFRAYGFQRYAMATPSGRTVGSGVQVICVVDEELAVVTDINLVNGARESRSLPVAELTYNRELLRAGR
jgi:hypothetical protein